MGYDECEEDVKQDKSRKEYANKGKDLRSNKQFGEHFAILQYNVYRSQLEWLNSHNFDTEPSSRI